jgi:hypothetical protein
VDQGSAGRIAHYLKDDIYKRTIPASDGIRTRNPSKPAAADLASKNAAAGIRDILIIPKLINNVSMSKANNSRIKSFVPRKLEM